MPSPRNTSSTAAAVIHVCVSAEVARTIEDAMRSMRWQCSTAHFDAYISAERRPSLSPQMKAADIKLAFVDFDNEALAAAETTRYLKQIFRNGIVVIAVGRPRDPDLLLTAMRSGCTEFLQKPVSPETLTEVLQSLSVSLNHADQYGERGSVFPIFGVKGGVGTTTLAVHLAMYLRQTLGKKTLLIDNHAELGHACVYLGLDGSQFNFQEVLNNVSRLDSELLRGYVAKHSSGLEVLSSPDTSGATRNADAESMRQTLEFLRGEYDFIIIDSAIGLDAATSVLLEAAAHAYLVTTPEIASLRDLSRYLESFKFMESVPEKLRIVLNRYASSSAVSLDQIETAIAQKVSHRFPVTHPELQRAENLGQTLPANSKLEFVTQMARWASGLAGQPVAAASQAKQKKSRLFGWMQVKEIAHT